MLNYSFKNITYEICLAHTSQSRTYSAHASSLFCDMLQSSQIRLVTKSVNSVHSWVHDRQNITHLRYDLHNVPQL